MHENVLASRLRPVIDPKTSDKGGREGWEGIEYSNTNGSSKPCDTAVSFYEFKNGKSRILNLLYD